MAILDSFHFKVSEHSVSVCQEDQEIEGEGEEMEDERAEGAVEDLKESSNNDCGLPQRIHSTILHTILPGLESCLTKEVWTLRTDLAQFLFVSFCSLNVSLVTRTS